TTNLQAEVAFTTRPLLSTHPARNSSPDKWDTISSRRRTQSSERAHYETRTACPEISAQGPAPRASRRRPPASDRHRIGERCKIRRAPHERSRGPRALVPPGRQP